MPAEENRMTDQNEGKPVRGLHTTVSAHESGQKPDRKEKVISQNLDLYYGKFKALEDINLAVLEKEVTAIIGPSGCGKSTLLRCFNRMNDLVPNCRVEGRVIIDGVNIYDKSVDVVDVRRKVGMVFQKPNPFPKSIYDNVAYGPHLYGITHRQIVDEIVETSLRQAALWDEVKDILKQSAYSLSGGQQQRLCIARALAVEPDIILMDEPASALDPIATYHIEELIRTIVKQVTIIIVTHNMQQAARVSDYTVFMNTDESRTGYLAEFGLTTNIFTKPKNKETEDYISGRFG